VFLTYLFTFVGSYKLQVVFKQKIVHAFAGCMYTTYFICITVLHVGLRIG